MAAKMPQNVGGCALDQLCEKELRLKMPEWGPQAFTGEQATHALPRPH